MVQGLAPFAPALHEPPGPEKAQVLREVGWANAGLADKRADRLLANSKLLEDMDSRRVREELENLCLERAQLLRGRRLRTLGRGHQLIIFAIA